MADDPLDGQSTTIIDVAPTTDTVVEPTPPAETIAQAHESLPAVGTSFRPLASPQSMWGLDKSLEQLQVNPRRVAVDLLRLFLANKTPLTLWGPVGSRKTRTIQSLAHEKDERGVPYQVITIQPSTEDPTVIHGMMYTSLGDDGQTTVMKRSLPGVVEQIVNYYREYGGLTVLFADEMTTCMPAQQHAMLGMLTHGVYGDVDISPYIAIVMAANPQNTVSDVNDLGEQVMNRGGHIAWFGDVNLFIEEWGSGFGDSKRAPDPSTRWFVENLLKQAPDKAFRNERWQENTLVPFERLEHTERVVTEFASMMTLINGVFSMTPPEVRAFYITEVARALMGNEWADSAAVVLQMQGAELTPASYIERVRGMRADLGLGTTPERLDELVGVTSGDLYTKGNGERLRQDEADTLIEGVTTSIRTSGFNMDAYIAGWMLCVGAPTHGQVNANLRHMIALMTIGREAAEGGVFPANQAIPTFVAPATRDLIRQAITGGAL